ncbi:MAG: hypothetical protein HYZ81_02860 [Nitrospinae bacterium]|nr:hypothetical protein [Nitrospinota bacterium]
MKTLIQGGWVVAFNGAAHEVYENGTVVYEGDRIIHAGGPICQGKARRAPSLAGHSGMALGWL